MTRVEFGGTRGWSMTEAGRVEGERRLAAELDAAGAREVVTDAYAGFMRLNDRLTTACTDWQIRPRSGDPLARNDHSDHRWDDRVLAELASIGRRLVPVTDRLAGVLPRLGVHEPRYAAAVRRSVHGEHAWVDAPDRASCHIVWIQLHEDLLATLGRQR